MAREAAAAWTLGWGPYEASSKEAAKSFALWRQLHAHELQGERGGGGGGMGEGREGGVWGEDGMFRGAELNSVVSLDLKVFPEDTLYAAQVFTTCCVCTHGCVCAHGCEYCTRSLLTLY